MPETRLIVAGNRRRTLALGGNLNYYLGLFTPYTWTGFRDHGSSVVGFPHSAEPRARKVEVGDIVIGYLSGLSRWCGAFEIKGKMYIDKKPLFSVGKETFVLRFPIIAHAVLDPRNAIPVDVLWSRLKCTKHISRDIPGWAVKAGLMSSLGPMDVSDGRLLAEVLSTQARTSEVFDLSHAQQLLLRRDDERRKRERKEESISRNRSAGTT
jgi:hypothetical protein